MTTKLIITTDRQTFKNDEDRINAYKELFGTEQGQRVLIDIMSHSGYFNPQAPQASEQAFIEAGKRSVCNFILNFLSIINLKKDS